MKLQHFAVIFVIIVLPISFLLSMFMQSKIDEINLKAEYDSRISDATYDGIKAFELNTNNENEKLTINQKEKEVKYAIETFYKTLANKFSYNGLDSNSLKDYTPALLFNLYDGFFIQSKYKNVEIEKNENKSSFELIYKIDYSNTTNEIKQEFNLEELESNQVKNLEKQGYSCK